MEKRVKIISLKKNFLNSDSDSPSTLSPRPSSKVQRGSKKMTIKLFNKAFDLSKSYGLVNHSESASPRKTREVEDSNNNPKSPNRSIPLISCTNLLFSSPQCSLDKLKQNAFLEKKNNKLNKIVSVRKYMKHFDSELKRFEAINSMAKTKLVVMSKEEYRVEAMAKQVGKMSKKEIDTDELKQNERANYRTYLMRDWRFLAAVYIFPSRNSPESRIKTNMVNCNDKIVIVGGLNSKKLNDVWSYDPSS